LGVGYNLVCVFYNHDLVCVFIMYYEYTVDSKTF